jgi:hypothetical protein
MGRHYYVMIFKRRCLRVRKLKLPTHKSALLVPEEDRGRFPEVRCSIGALSQRDTGYGIDSDWPLFRHFFWRKYLVEDSRFISCAKKATELLLHSTIVCATHVAPWQGQYRSVKVYILIIVLPPLYTFRVTRMPFGNPTPTRHTYIPI